TPQQGIQALLLDVLADTDLPTGTVNSLSAKLRAAQASLGRGMSKTALNQLDAFRNELDAVVKTGRMSSTLAAQLARSEDRVEATGHPIRPFCVEQNTIMNRIRSLALFGVLAIVACAEPPVSPLPTLSSGRSIASITGDVSYLLLAKGNTLPSGLAAKVIAA